MHNKSINTNNFTNNLTFRRPWISFLHLNKELSLDLLAAKKREKNDDLYKGMEDLYIFKITE